MQIFATKMLYLKIFATKTTYLKSLQKHEAFFIEISMKGVLKERKSRQNVNSRQTSVCWGPGPAVPQLLPPWRRVTKRAPGAADNI